MVESQADRSEAISTDEPTAVAPGEIVLGTIAGISSSGQPLVNYENNRTDGPVAALSTVALTPKHKNRQVALLFADGDWGKPVIMGLIHSPLDAILDGARQQDSEGSLEAEPQDARPPASSGEAVVAEVDGDRVVIEGNKEITLRCGESSITLTRAGKILIRGKYILNRSSGVNRIMGGSVQVN